MKFLVDESVEYSIVLFLRETGHDVKSVAEDFPTSEDSSILSYSNKANRILITNDKDFGELIYRLKYPHKGVILFRLSTEDSKSKTERLRVVIKKYSDKLINHFVVISDDKIRIRKSEVSIFDKG